MIESRKLLPKLFAVLLGATLLIFLWHRNYNLIGDTYDYSIVTSVGGLLHAGLKPYRDFATPLQSLTIYLCYLAELIFGRRYLALAYMNLIFGLAFYATLILALKKYIAPLLGVAAATAICAATFFQHGVLWYNSLAIALLMLIVLCAATMYRRQSIGRGTFSALCVLFFLSSVCKMNYHVLALGLAGGIMALLFLMASDQRKKIVWVLPAAIFSGVLLGPTAEIFVNGTTLQRFWYCVFTTPKHRLARLFGFLDPNFWLGKVSDFLPDNWCGGVYLYGLLVFCGCFYFLLRAPSTNGNQPGLKANAVRFFGPVVLVAFFFTSALVTITNSEIEWLTASFLMVGLLAAFIMFAPGMSSEQTLCFKLGIFLLVGFFLVGASASAFMHARVRPGETSWTKAMLEVMYKAKRLSALKNAVPFYPAEEISPELSPYFGGMRFTGFQSPRMVKIVGYMDKYDLVHQQQKVYWGSGLQMINRVYDNVPRGNFPLWYHLNVSVRNEDSPAIIESLKTNNYEWVFCTHWIVEMPDGVRRYLTNNFDNIGDDDVLVFHKKPASAAATNAVELK